MKSKCLFIGGCLDGQFRDVPGYSTRLMVMPFDDSATSWNPVIDSRPTQEYIASVFRLNSKTVRVFSFSVPDDEVLDRLIESYAKHNAKL